MENPALHDAAAKRALDVRLSRVEGQVRGLRRMIENEEPCESIALQLAAARKALDQAFYQMVSCMVRTAAAAGPVQRREHADKLVEILTRFG